MANKNRSKLAGGKLGFWIIILVAVGGAIGLATDIVAVGVSIAVAIGIIIGGSNK